MFSKKTVGISEFQTRIVRVEGVQADHHNGPNVYGHLKGFVSARVFRQSLF